MSTLRARELSAGGRGAIRVLELAGEGALACLERLLRGRPGPRADAFAPVALRGARGELLDEAIVLVESPSRVELHLHGAPALVARILAELGLAAEEPRPRTLEQLAEARLAAAASEAAARMLLDQAEGALRAELEALLRRPDEGFLAGARGLARRGRVARALLDPPRVVLAGPVNAGKSTLFNLLVGRERVVVDPAPGTTRDAVEERIQLGAYVLRLYDSAGERPLDPVGAEACIERAGQALAAELRSRADLVVWLVPPGHEPPRQSPARMRLVGSCADRASSPPAVETWPTFSVRRDPAHARAVFEELVHEALELPTEPWVPGAGVPFEPPWVELLEHGGPAELRSAVRGWLAASLSSD